MVGFDPKQSVVLPHYVYGICGASAAFLSRFFTQPVDVCKIRFQLQIEPIRRGEIASKYQGLSQAVGLIVREEGVLALWKGLLAAQLLSTVYGLVQFGTFELLNRALWTLRWTDNPRDPFLYFLCGSVSGVAATVAAQPLDVVRTRFVSQGRQKVYNSLWQSLTLLRRQEGLRGFYRGLVPAVIQIVPYNGASFAFYAQFQSIYRRFSGNTSAHSDALESLTCGIFAGGVAKTLIYPLDVFKKRLQVQGFEEGRRGFGRMICVDSLRQCVGEMWRIEGLSGFYKGYSPSLIKAALATGINFYCYEQFLKLFRTYYESK
ncbi:mitochondrial thiamine pyrophosphate carrier-like [Paramacrobiotus metropolitanus]|uniref:mitochondrial thiamine pyrophosphate carrier-like n=1 Tax=Paramacrobiotus metropolitanus TaxID=2943436 RepID=UPI00244631CE|nr:mitochondrial thiamine pyrophosphate carrier-like [Paramacrobiotus metropolitanus]XP_055348557.1 mitochondrial thiamine pyrophosphate carrier-like [Paramacrobiotus metropolitanus]